MKRKIETLTTAQQAREVLGWMSSYGEVLMKDRDDYPPVRYFVIPAEEDTEYEDESMVAVVAEQVGVLYYDRDLGCSSGIVDSAYIDTNKVPFPHTFDELAEITEESIIGLFKRYGHDCSIR